MFRPPRRARGLFPSDSRTTTHRERDILDAAHGVAVVSRVDSSGEDLMQMHPRRPGWEANARGAQRALLPSLLRPRESFPLRLSRDSPRCGSGLRPRPPFVSPRRRPSYRSSSAAAARIAARLRKCPDAPTAGCTGAQMREESKSAGGGGVKGGGEREPGACWKRRSSRGRWAARASTL